MTSSVHYAYQTSEADSCDELIDFSRVRGSLRRRSRGGKWARGIRTALAANGANGIELALCRSNNWQSIAAPSVAAQRDAVPAASADLFYASRPKIMHPSSRVIASSRSATCHPAASRRVTVEISRAEENQENSPLRNGARSTRDDAKSGLRSPARELAEDLSSRARSVTPAQHLSSRGCLPDPPPSGLFITSSRDRARD